MDVSRHPDVFCSGQGTNIIDLPVEVSEFMGSMINMDAPRHTRLRMIVNRAFTPRMVARIDDDVRVKARKIVARGGRPGRVRPGRRSIAAPLPLQIICEMMGIPRGVLAPHPRAHQRHPGRPGDPELPRTWPRSWVR